MPSIYRKIIFITFAALFLISAPLLVLYTMGYRLNINSGRIEQRGALVVKSSPDGAEIFIRGRKLKEKTPATINLPSDEYEVGVRKDGYLPWRKRILVQSRVTSFVENIILWKQENPSLIIAVPLRRAAFSPDRRFAVTVAEDGVVDFFDLVRGNAVEVGRISGEAEISFSADGYSAAVRSDSDMGDQILAFRMTDPEPRAVFINLDALGFQSLTWGDGATNFLGVKEGYLVSYNIFTKREEQVAESGEIFALRGTEVWSIKERRDGAELVRSRAGIAAEALKPILRLPKDSYSFESSPPQFLIIKRQEAGRMLVIDSALPERPVMEMTGLHARSQARSGAVELLSWNDFELWFGNIVTGTQELLRRQSEKIKDADWHPKGGYVIYSTENSIEAMEMGGADGNNLNLTELAKITDGRIEGFAVTADGNSLYFAVSGGQNPGIYKLTLQ